MENFTITINGQVDKAYETRKAFKKHTATFSNMAVRFVEALQIALEQAEAECTMYNHNPALYSEYVAQKRFKKEQQLRAKYFTDTTT